MSQKRIETPEFQPTPAFLARQKRIDDALNLRKPDRVPVVPAVAGFYPTRQRGISNRDAMNNMDKTFSAWKEAAIEYDWDAALSPGPLYAARPLEILGIKQLKWPGGDLPDGQPFQWVEGEYMMQDEYDEALADPNGYAVKKIWPRISSTLAPLSAMVQMPPPPLLFLSAHPAIQGFLGEMLSAPPVMEILKKALELAEAHTQLKQQTMGYVTEVMQSGYPVVFGGASVTAFDWVSDAFRGMKGSMLDMYRVPDKLLAMVEMFIPLSVGSSLMMTQQAGLSKGVFIPMHRGAAGFMNDKQFAKFYWPGFKALINGIIDAGLTPVPVFEGDYNSRLEYLQELPAKKILGHFDVIDRKKAKKMLGDRMAFWGNVPASLMCAGTPQQVKDDVKELIDIFGDNGGLIIDGASGIPDEAKPENVRALTEAVYEYGVYH